MCNDLYLLNDIPLPQPDQVESELARHGSTQLMAQAALADNGIDAPTLGVGYFQSTIACDDERYSFEIYKPEHVGPKFPPDIAIEVREDGKLVDVILVDPDTHDVRAVTCRTKWLGKEQLSNSVIRLHRHPLDWLAAGGVGVCHIGLINRQPLKALQAADSILCDDMPTFLEAWEYGFSCDMDSLSRFVIDAEPDHIRSYYERQAFFESRTVKA